MHIEGKHFYWCFRPVFFSEHPLLYHTLHVQGRKFVVLCEHSSSYFIGIFVYVRAIFMILVSKAI
jgi:hypothetical protein